MRSQLFDIITRLPPFIFISVLSLILGIVQIPQAFPNTPTQNEHSGPLSFHSSFLKLESGENSDEMVNQCCIRQSNFISLGQGIDGEELRLDVGSCLQRCAASQTLRPLKREEFDKFLKKYPNMDPIQRRLGIEDILNGSITDVETTLSSSTTLHLSSASCLSASCLPTLTRRHYHFSLSGQSEEIDVVESCDCLPHPLTCIRESKLVRYHDGTPFEQTVDVGQCRGPCESGDGASSCRSIRNRTHSVDGPNGVNCVAVIEECQCVGNCFRSRSYHKVYDYSLIYNKLRTGTGRDDGEGNTTSDPLIKVIDIGKCQGSCMAHNQGESKCLIWSPKNETCLSSLYGGQSHCGPTKLVSHFYIDRTGHRHSLISVTSCGCR